MSAVGAFDLATLFPSRWKVSRFAAVFTESPERNGDRKVGVPLSVSEYRGVIPRNDDLGQAESEDVSGYRVVRPGQLAANVMWLNRSGLGVSAHLGYVSPAYKVFEIADAACPRFADFVLRSSAYRSFFESAGRGVRPNAQMVDSSDLATMPFPLPTVAEQQAIANYLDRETARIDTLIGEQQRLVEMLQERRAAVVDKSLEVGAQWTRCSLKMMLSAVDQGVSPQAESGLADEPGAWGVLKSGSPNRGVFRQEEHKRLPDDYAFDRSLAVVTGDLIVSRASGSPDLVGSAAMVGALAYDLILSDKLFRLRPAAGVDARFLYWSLNGQRYRRQVGQAISGAAGLANNLPLSSLRRFELGYPSLDEQRRIAAYLDEQTAKIDLLIAESERLIDLSRERRSALITAAVTGQIDVRDEAA